MSNWKAAPFTVLRMWAQRRALVTNGIAPRDADTELLEWESDALVGAELQQRSQASPLLIQLMAQYPNTKVARFVCELRQMPRSISVSDWVLLTFENSAIIGCVAEMACIVTSEGSSLCCLYCTRCAQRVSEHADGSMWIRKADLQATATAMYDEVSVNVLSRHDRGEYNEYLYVF